MKKTFKQAGMLALSVLLASCAAGPSDQDVAQATQKVLKSSFTNKGIATVDRLVPDATNKACSEAQGAPLDEKTAKSIEALNMKTVKMPSDGKFIGDWKAGEKIAQSGKGLTWKEKAGDTNGGSCYNCHQVSKEELSFGSIGPSLYNYGKLRGVKDPADPASKAIVEYTWGKLWNAKAYSACSDMPRFGHAGILEEGQIRDVMALLLDPKSPVNK